MKSLCIHTKNMMSHKSRLSKIIYTSLIRTAATASMFMMGCQLDLSSNIKCCDSQSESLQECTPCSPDSHLEQDLNLDAALQSTRPLDLGSLDLGLDLGNRVDMSGLDFNTLSDADTSSPDMMMVSDMSSSMTHDANLSIDAEISTVDMTLMDMEMVSVSMCSEGEAQTQCLFGLNSRSLIDDPRLQVTSEFIHTEEMGMTPLEQEQLIFGFQCEGTFMPMTVEEAFALIDRDGVRVYRIRGVNPDRLYTWFRFYMGDTEVGYIFRQGSLELVAQVSDQDIIRCDETYSSSNPMTCSQLDECLQQCDSDDVECRQPCLYATEQPFIELYISLEECRINCNGEQACLNTICADERQACFEM